MYLRIALACLVASGLSSRTLAQSPSPQPATPAAMPTAPADQLLTAPQVDALIAPIALYPDTLLAQILMASTYPLEVIQADRWVTANKRLKGDQLKTEAEKQGWDDSVKALVATPAVLEMMSKNLEWTQKLGDAVLAQQPDLMDGIQRMRTRAYDNKKLSSTPQQKVTVQQVSGRQTIAIEPAVQDTVYVPYYDPAVVYGSWPYPAYPPYYFPAPGYVAAGVVATGLAFGAAYALGRWAWGGGSGYWGGNINWNNNNINIDRDRVSHWEHNPQHRRGVQYRNNAVQQRFGNNTLRAGSEGRQEFRGRGGDQVLRPDGGRPDRGNIGSGARPEQRPAGDRANAGGRADRGPGDRAGAGNRQGDRAGAANRQGNRAGAGQARQKAQTRPAQSRPSGARPSQPRRDNAFGNVQSGRAANLQSQRGRASFAGGGGGRPAAARGGYGGGPRMGGGGMGGARMGGGGMGGARMGGGGRGGGGRGGGRRSDITLKTHIELLGWLENGVGFYRFEYKGSDPTPYVGVMAQEVQGVMPRAVSRGADGYLRVNYEQLGVKFQTFQQWQASGSRLPAGAASH